MVLLRPTMVKEKKKKKKKKKYIKLGMNIPTRGVPPYLWLSPSLSFDQESISLLLILALYIFCYCHCSSYWLSLLSFSLFHHSSLSFQVLCLSFFLLVGNHWIFKCYRCLLPQLRMTGIKAVLYESLRR